MKLLIFHLLVVFSGLCLFADTMTIGGVTWRYTVTDRVAMIGGGSSSSTAVSTSTKGDVTIPDTLGTYPVYRVNRIGSSAFYGCRNLTSVVIPSTVVNIEDSAFYNCSGMKNVVIPDAVTNIGVSAFFGCSSLTNVLIPCSVANIADHAFYGCSGLKSVVIPDGVTSIEDYAFYGCSGLMNVIIPNTVTNIGVSAFAGCSGLTSIIIPDSVASIGPFAFGSCKNLVSVELGRNIETVGEIWDEGYVFSSCANLRSIRVSVENPKYKEDGGMLLSKDGERLIAGINGNVIIPAGVTSVGRCAFYGYEGLTSVTIPNTVTNIGMYAFNRCYGLTSVTIPDSVTGIESFAFLWCGLNDVTIPESISHIGERAFCGCKCFHVDEQNQFYSSCNGFLLSKDGATLIQGVVCQTTIPESVKTIGDHAFTGLFADVSLSSKMVAIPDNVTRIGNSAFSSCNWLEQITIGNGVTNIGAFAFEGCSRLTSISIPPSVKYIGERAFDRCRGLSAVYISDISLWCKISFGDASSNPLSKAKNLYLNGQLVADLRLPDDIMYVGDYAFAGCLSLTNVTMPDTIVGIGDYAFLGCQGLTDVIMPNSVMSIGDGAFKSCVNLIRITLPAAVMRIGQSAFSECGLQSVAIPETITNIADCTFNACINLVDATIPETVTNIGRSAFSKCGLLRVAIPGSVLSIGDAAFEDCKSLSDLLILDSVENIGSKAFCGCGRLANVSIPNSVTNVGQNAFLDCVKIRKATIPQVVCAGNIGRVFCDNYGYQYYKNITNICVVVGVTNIGDRAFLGCNSLVSITIPESVTSIGDRAFESCTNLARVTIPNNVARIGSSAFYNCSGLTSVTIPESVESIGSSAFTWCSNLASVEIPDNVTSIETCSFYGCSGLVRVTIPACVACIGASAFSKCRSLSLVTMKGDCPAVVESAFSDIASSCIVRLPMGNDTYVLSDGKWQGMSVGYGYTVTFDANGGNGGWSQTFECGSPIAAPEITRDGYTFAGWLPDVPGTVPEDDVIYIAQWTPNKYVVTFDPNGGLGGWSQSLDCGTKLQLPLVIREGYTFAGWLPSVDESVPARDVTYMAQWKLNQYSVTFDANGGDNGWEQSLDFGSAILPPVVTRVGYTFTGWSPTVPAIVPASDVTYTAQWKINQYTVTFDSAGGTTVATITQDYATAITPPENPAKTGYTFIGWSPSVPATMPANDTTCVAQWKINQYTISFDSDCGMPVSPITQDYAATITPPADPTRTGYTFMGWSPSVPTTMPAANMTCIAQWKINQYTVTFDSPGGPTILPITQDYATAITPPEIPTREGYTFMGWTPSVPSTMPAANTTCVAQWKIRQYTISFDSAGGTSVPPITQDYATVITPPVNPTKTGYTFIGWTPSVPATMPADDTTCVAQWNANQYRVMFDANGGSGGWAKSLDYGSAINVPEVFRQGCTLEGWLPTPDSTVPAHDVAYVAQWKVWDVTVSSASAKIKDLYPNDYQHITNVVIAASVHYLPENFFDGCGALENVTFVSPDTELGNNDLRRVGKLFANQPDGYWIVQGVLLGYKGVCPREIPGLDSVKRVMGDALEGCAALEELSFTAESVLTTIGTNAFKHCTELRQMTLPPSLIEIGNEAFMGCSYLGNVIVPGSVKKVGDRAFKNCTGFTAAQIEYGVESLGEEAFCGDWRISEVDIPSTVTNIGVNAFGGDSSIIRIGLRGDVRKASDIFSNYKFIREATVKEGTGEIVDGLFSGFEKLRDVRFFGNCPQLENEGQLLYAMTPGKSDDNTGLTTYVEANSTGWDGTPGSHSLPQAWPLAGGSRRAIAYWDVPSYLCQFESNGGTLGVQDTYQYSEKPFVLPPEPVQSGYKFAGWWTKPVGGLHVTSDTIFIEGVYTMLYAHWIKGHWVFLDPNGGTVVNDYVTYVEETTYGVLPSPVRSGYAFNGWLYNDIVIEPTTVISDKNDHTLVAQWTANLYSVRYHANGGVGSMDDESRTYGVEQALRKNIFVNDGYIFAGWATNETDEIIYSDCEVVSNMTAVANGWIDLYAVWEEGDITPDPSNLNFYFSGNANWERCVEGVEVERDGETMKFASVWKSGFVTNLQSSVLAADVHGAGKIGFWWKVSCESFRNWKLDNLEFAIDGVPQEPWINGVTDWQYLEFEVNETGPHTLTWTYSKDESDEGMDVGEDCGRVVAAVWTPSLVTLGDYVNCPRLEFRTSGGAEWAGDRQISHDGIASLRSGKIDHNGTTAVELDVMGEGRIGFWWKASSEAFRQIPIDYVSFKIDDVEQAWIGGEVDWTNVAFDVVGEGPHVLSWTYQKDGEGDEGEDCAWIDEVVWIPNVVSTVPEVSPEEAAVWVSNDLAARYAKSGESAADYQNRFEAKFGSDLVAAMTMPTDKKDAQGNNMYVWQDYVAGTDPTDTNSVFIAMITMVDGAPVVEWSPKLGAAEESLRRYTIYGRAGLESGEEWHAPTNALDRFFTVGVEMK